MEERKPKVAVSILNYRGAEFAEEAVKSMLAQTYGNFELFFTDNASGDGSVEAVRRISPRVKTFANSENIGYGAAHQKVMEAAFGEGGFDAVVLVNFDVVADPEWLVNLVNTAYSAESAGPVQPTVYVWRDGKTSVINTDGGVIHFLGFGYCGNYGVEGPVFRADRRVAFASGCSMLVRREVYEATGGFDTDLFLYLEDVDLSWRSLLLGYAPRMSANSRLWHRYHFDRKTDSETKMYFLERNRHILLLKNFSLRTLVLITPALLLMEAGVLLYYALRGIPRVKVKSYFGVLKQLPRTLRKRGVVQKTRRVSDRQVLELFTGELRFSEIDNPLLSLVNPMFRAYFEIIRHLV